MNFKEVGRNTCLGLVLLLGLAACDSGTPQTAPQATPAAIPQAVSDDDLIRAQVQAAIANATDLPDGFTVTVSEGRVSVSGSMVCEDCGGMRTPGNIGTVQQTLGATIRAVPGVDSVEFALDYGQ